MTTQPFVVPYRRTSPVHIPRRDLVLAATDDLALRVSIVESDDAAAQALDLTGGIGGPALRLVLWRDEGRHWWDYGAPTPRRPEVLWTGTGAIVDDALGSFDVAIPQGTMSDWPRRCGYWLFLDWNGGEQSEMLAQGALHVARAIGSPTMTADGLLTAGSVDLLTADSEPLTTA